MSELKLSAHDEEDLEVISAHLQDAVLRVGDLAYLPKQRRFAGVMNRFQWEAAAKGKRSPKLRSRTGLHFDLVGNATQQNIKQDNPDGVLSLLAIQFEAGNPPSGVIRLMFSGGGEIRLDVEAIEVHMRDLGLVREAAHIPHHDLD